MLRAPSCAGHVYPADPVALRAALDAWLGIPPPSPRPSPSEPVRLILAPHIDYPRGAPGYALAYSALPHDADLFVVLGTAHSTPPHLFTLTRDDFDTPLGPVATDRSAVDAIAAQVGEHEVLADARCHAEEHSIELQVVVLKHVVRRRFEVLPVLCSSIVHLEEPARFTARFLDALRRAVAGRKVCFVASADLAHVGPGYGDPRPPSSAELAWLEAQDRRTLGFLEAGDAEGFHRAAARDDARRRLCGIALTYAAIRASGRAARVLHYGRWTDGRDSVSFAAAAG